MLLFFASAEDVRKVMLVMARRRKGISFFRETRSFVSKGSLSLPYLETIDLKHMDFFWSGCETNARRYNCAECGAGSIVVFSYSSISSGRR